MDGKIPIGLQLYSVRQDCAADLPRVLKEVARMGYEGVEFAGFHGWAAEELRTMLEDVGLACCGSHIKLATLMGDEFEQTVEFNKLLGNKYLIVPSLEAKYTESAEAWKRTAEIFNGIAERLKPFMMQTGYHNHFTEFKPMAGDAAGQTAWDVLFSNTRPDVIMQLDTGNALHAGVDVTPYLSRYPGRATTVHLKEYSATGKAHATLIGDGEIRWPEMLELCERVGGTKWFIVEQSEHNNLPSAMEGWRFVCSGCGGWGGRGMTNDK